MLTSIQILGLFLIGTFSMTSIAILIFILIIGLLFTSIAEDFCKDRFPFLGNLKSAKIILIYILVFIEAFVIASIFSPESVSKSGAETLNVVSYYGTVMTAVGLILTFIETTRSVRSSQSVKSSLIKAVNDYDNQHCINLLSNLTEDIYSASYTDAYLNFKIFRKILLKHSGYQKIITKFQNGFKNTNPSVPPAPVVNTNPSVPPDPVVNTNPSVPPASAVNTNPSVPPDPALNTRPLIAPPDLEDKEWLMEYIATKTIDQRIDRLEAKLIILAHKGRVSLSAVYKTELISEIMALRSIVEKEAHTYDSQ